MSLEIPNPNPGEIDLEYHMEILHEARTAVIEEAMKLAEGATRTPTAIYQSGETLSEAFSDIVDYLLEDGDFTQEEHKIALATLGQEETLERRTELNNILGSDVLAMEIKPKDVKPENDSSELAEILLGAETAEAFDNALDIDIEEFVEHIMEQRDGDDLTLRQKVVKKCGEIATISAGVTIGVITAKALGNLRITRQRKL